MDPNQSIMSVPFQFMGMEGIRKMHAYSAATILPRCGMTMTEMFYLVEQEIFYV